jgi:hypothetical protein
MEAKHHIKTMPPVARMDLLDVEVAGKILGRYFYSMREEGFAAWVLLRGFCCVGLA